MEYNNFIVECVNNDLNVTEGHRYEVYQEDEKYYWIKKNRYGASSFYPKEWFKKVEKYTVQEVLQMPKGTILKLFPYDESEREVIVAEGIAGNKYLYYIDNDGSHEEAVIISSWIMQEPRFKKVQRPVEFIEVIKSDNRCKVIYEKYDIDTLYNTLDKIIKLIVVHRKECDLQELITEGKWYLEE